MIDRISNYEKAKISMARVFLQYDQAAMIHKYSLEYDSGWLYITFVNRIYRINRQTGNIQWSDHNFPRTADFLRIPLTFLTEKPLNYVMPV